MFGKSDLEVLTDEIIKTREISHDLHIAITKKALTTSSELSLKIQTIDSQILQTFDLLSVS